MILIDLMILLVFVPIFLSNRGSAVAHRQELLKKHKVTQGSTYRAFTRPGATNGQCGQVQDPNDNSVDTGVPRTRVWQGCFPFLSFCGGGGSLVSLRLYS